MYSFLYVNILIWADMLFQKLRPETGVQIWKTQFALARCFVANLCYFMRKLTSQLFYQNYLPISISFSVKRVLLYALRNIPSYKNLISTRELSVWEKSKFDSVFFLWSSSTLLSFLSICKSELNEDVLFLTMP